LLGAAVLVAGLVTTVGSSPAGAAAPKAHRITVSPQIRPAGAVRSGVFFGCQTNPLFDPEAGPRCYQPAQIQKAYGVTPLLRLGQNGSGRTIAIIDAFGSPTMQQDLQVFDQTFGLPPANLTQIEPAGSPPPFDPNNDNQFGWAVETSLDVEWANAIAPGANILLAVAPGSDDTQIFATMKYVIDHNLADVVSMSFGEAEQCMDPTLLDQQHALFAEAVRKGITLFASSGDSGAAQPACDPKSSDALFAASTPASDPNVTGVGGTTLLADSRSGAYIGETAWTEVFGCNPPAVAPQDVNCSGGGFSSVYSRPSYQRGFVPGNARGVPDVAYNAGDDSGVLIHLGFVDPDPRDYFVVGGTSAGSPQWAGIDAIADQMAHRRLGAINPALYHAASIPSLYSKVFHDIKTGDNFVQEIDNGFDAGRGWDPVTGLGSPRADKLVPMLVGSV
jgi:subtilase family serine protease